MAYKRGRVKRCNKGRCKTVKVRGPKRRPIEFRGMDLYAEAVRTANTALDEADKLSTDWGGSYGACDSALINLVRASDWLGRAKMLQAGSGSAVRQAEERLHGILTRFHCGCGKSLVGKDKW